MRVRIRHHTEYRYGEPAALGPHIVRLRPATHARTPLLAYNLGIDPECRVHWQFDPWGNRIARLSFEKEQALDRLALTVDATFDIRPVNPFDFYIDDRCERLPIRYPDGLETELAPFRRAPVPGPRLEKFLGELTADGYVIDYLVALNAAVSSRVGYIIRNEPGIQTSEETLKIGTGSCRDSAVLLVDILRTHGLAARFVSGYLIQLTDEGNLPDEARGVSHDVVDLHAWAEVYIPGAGWIGLDGTSGLLCGEGHIPLACTVQPELAAPVSGTSSEPATGFHFEMEVVRLGHEPRPRVPYSDEQWEAVLATADTVDASLVHSGIELTSGGEPTWTSREHPDLPEWNTEALGETKWSQGLRMASEVRARMAPGSVVLRRMGKQYPGESLPRWALDLIWRADGVPVWCNEQLLALPRPLRERTLEERKADARASQKQEVPALSEAESFAADLARRLDLAPALIEGFEDPGWFLDKEARLPDGIDPRDLALDDDEERRRLARALVHGLGKPVGWALPMQWAQGRWVSAPWKFRRGRMFLVPGDSPMGLRLPLQEWPVTPPSWWPADTTTLEEQGFDFDPRSMRRMQTEADSAFDPTDDQGRLRNDGVSTRRATDAAASSLAVDAKTIFTALCVEPREGRLHVFLPPVPNTEAFLELLAEIEEAAEAAGLPVALEGYGPPSDPRLRSCTVTPDPGVIEVNLPVARTTREYLASMELLSEAAVHAGLSTEKYQLDGRQAGSGGGNHLTLGGPNTARSPFLVEPRLLAAVLRYLQNHPSLSYLFTGLFVGPTSQAPRVDEARHDALYELELALEQLEALPPAGFPWQADRLLRNLLADVSGNTHRTEVSIDKLYDPHSPAGRQGLLEFRAFEMPPHERMAAVQMLLLRALVAMLGRGTWRRPLVRWGSRLHDRFLLPHFLWRDICDVTGDLQRAGLPVQAEWFQPFLDFRCPRLGLAEFDGVVLELRAALEPWPTLGEQPTGATTSRYVDSSVERVELSVSGMTEGRHRIGVAGLALPLHATEEQGRFVAGVRFRAWQPPFCLHPEIPVHHPLRFDVVDTWARRSLGACTYHVWHPEGRAFDHPPLTAFEAAARRAQRFTTEGHMPWPADLRETTPHPEQPLTLDLRRYLRGPGQGHG